MSIIRRSATLVAVFHPAYVWLASHSHPVKGINDVTALPCSVVCSCGRACVLRFSRSDRLLEHCSIALVGKYTKFSDSYASVIKALEHSALAISHKLDVKVQ